MHWDETGLADVYAAARELTADALATWRHGLAALVPPAREIRRVVDLGCGTGRFTALLAELYDATVVGIDASTRMLANRDSRRDGALRFVAGAAEALPLAEGTADLAFLSMVYHHLRSAPAALDEIHRVLRPGGEVVVRNPTREAHEEGYEYLRFFPGVMDIERARMPSREGLTRTFLDHGFTRARHVLVDQQIAATHSDLLRRVRLRGFSSLAAIPDAAFAEGLCELERYCRTRDATGPVIEPIDVFAFARPR